MEIEHFKGVDDAGKTHQVVARRRIIHKGPPPIYGVPEYRLSDGRSLTPAGDGNRTFKVVATGEVITII